MWSTMASRERCGTPLPPTLLDPPPVGTHAVQVLRTYGRKRPSYPFATDGERSVARAYAKAFGQARSLIYLEDQYMWSSEVARLFASVTEAGPLAVIRTDVSGHIIYANARWGDLLNDPEARLIGRAWRHVLAREHLHELLRRSAESGGTREPFTMRVRANDASIADSRANEGYEGRHWGEVLGHPDLPWRDHARPDWKPVMQEALRTCAPWRNGVAASRCA